MMLERPSNFYGYGPGMCVAIRDPAAVTAGLEYRSINAEQKLARGAPANAPRPSLGFSAGTRFVRLRGLGRREMSPSIWFSATASGHPVVGVKARR